MVAARQGGCRQGLRGTQRLGCCRAREQRRLRCYFCRRRRSTHSYTSVTCGSTGAAARRVWAPLAGGRAERCMRHPAAIRECWTGLHSQPACELHQRTPAGWPTTSATAVTSMRVASLQETPSRRTCASLNSSRCPSISAILAARDRPAGGRRAEGGQWVGSAQQQSVPRAQRVHPGGAGPRLLPRGWPASRGCFLLLLGGAAGAASSRSRLLPAGRRPPLLAEGGGLRGDAAGRLGACGRGGGGGGVVHLQAR